ncbi:SEL1-like repeat protein [Bartonella sp. W8122]|nr:SEL1-like repeat protein [Bartonella sp. W8122]
MLYYEGFEIPQNKNEAIKLFDLAAQQGHIDAKNFLKQAY